MADNEHFATPTEQHLNATEIATITRMSVPDPPELVLMLDVVHDETKLAWRQEVRFTARQMIEITQLLVYSCQQVGIDWRPNDHNDFTPPEP